MMWLLLFGGCLLAELVEFLRHLDVVVRSLGACTYFLILLVLSLSISLNYHWAGGHHELRLLELLFNLAKLWWERGLVQVIVVFII